MIRRRARLPIERLAACLSRSFYNETSTSATGGFMRYLSLALLLLSLLLQPGATAAADKDSELQSLYSTLNMLNQEQQAIYQQFQMLQEVRRSNVPFYGTSMLPPLVGAPANYDEIVAKQKSAIQRDEDLSQQANQLLDKYNEIEEMKKPLRLKIHSLTLSK
jgi:hypothetical protein